MSYFATFKEVILSDLVIRMKQPRVNRAASALAFTTILSLVPMLIVVFHTLTFFKVFDMWHEVTENFFYENYLPATGELVRGYLQEFSVQTQSFTVMGVVSLLLTIFFLFLTIETTLNDIWRVKKGRPFFKRILICCAIVLIGPLLILSSLSISLHIVSISLLPNIFIPILLKIQLIEVLPYLIELVTFFLIFFIIPNQKVFVRYALLGALVSTILFEVSKHIFTIYILKYNSYQIIYHALWTIPAFFVWIYISWLVVLIGACVTAELSVQQTIK